MVEVFKTNVKQTEQAAVLVTALSQQFPMHYINFDLDDCDKILRIEGNSICVSTIIQLLQLQGYFCEPLA
ncbi:hypothetical protein KXQ82_18850 [Mucilaginibacter sp. HMF5004]|uniref:hypothetical protein n=1 Tax=Mucilaginibacter rivuli TaxID=2857527 RepID=UPI001C5F33D9|nr:hypothetical protein [Mucilaginibacter rivuli]MBW4891792.1 hypothetical protein [Mucilaginibacter rivuli]